MASCHATVPLSSQTNFFSPDKVFQVEFRPPFQADSPECSGGGGGSQVLIESSHTRPGSTSGSPCSRPNPDHRRPQPWVGGGGSSGRAEVLRSWSHQESLLHINLLEALAVFRGLQVFEQSPHTGVLLVQTDNTTVLSYLNRRGGTRSRSLDQVTQEITLWCLDGALPFLQSIVKDPTM